MACQTTPTATLFETTVSTSFSISTSVSTETRVITADGVILITTCVPVAVVGPSATPTCTTSVITSSIGSLITSTILHTTIQTVPPPVLRTFTNPTQTLFATTCPPDNPISDTTTPSPRTRPTVTVTTTPDEPANTTPPTTTTTPTSTTPSTTSYLPPVTLTSVFTSTDPNGLVIVQTAEIVSTPTADLSQYGSSNSSTNNTPAIIGGVVGGAAALIAIIAIVWFILYKKRSGRWDDIWEGDDAHQAGAAETKGPRPAVDDNGLSPNPYVYGVVGRGTPSPLLRGDRQSTVHTHSRSASTATGYADHGRTNSQTPLMLATSPPHSPPDSPPSLQPQQLHGLGAGLDRRRTPVWASPSAQQGYFQQGYPPIPSDPNFTPTVTSTYSAVSRAPSATASSTHGPHGGFIPPTQTAANSAMAYPPGAAPPVIGAARGSTYSEYHKPPLEQPLQGTYHPPSQHQQPGPNGSTANLNLMDASIDKSAEFYSTAAGSASVHKSSIRYDKGDSSFVNSVPMDTPDPNRKTSLVPVPPGVDKAMGPATILEDAPPAYMQ